MEKANLMGFHIQIIELWSIFDQPDALPTAFCNNFKFHYKKKKEKKRAFLLKLVQLEEFFLFYSRICRIQQLVENNSLNISPR